ncbi:MAG: hypothetical protein IT260_21365 [Saprospiraceae bacterium]|nr:hypothetical protein [Saprospiraceae bacterium]
MAKDWLPHRFVALWALVILALPACHSPYEALAPAPGIPVGQVLDMQPRFGARLYKTEVDVVGKHLSGLLLFKTMPDSSKRVVFTSETGPTLFDFSFAKDGAFEVKYCLKALRRKSVLRTLRQDFELLLLENPGQAGPAVLRDSSQLYFPFRNGKDTNYFRTDLAAHRLLGMEKAGRRKQKVQIDISPTAAGLPDSVRIEHRNFTFAIRMKTLERPAPDSE